MPLEDLWILHRLNQVSGEISEALDKFRFHEAVEPDLPVHLARVVRLVYRADEAGPDRSGRTRRARGRRGSWFWFTRWTARCGCCIRSCLLLRRRSGRRCLTRGIDHGPGVSAPQDRARESRCGPEHAGSDGSNRRYPLRARRDEYRSEENPGCRAGHNRTPVARACAAGS